VPCRRDRSEKSTVRYIFMTALLPVENLSVREGPIENDLDNSIRSEPHVHIYVGSRVCLLQTNLGTLNKLGKKITFESDLISAHSSTCSFQSQQDFSAIP